MFFKYGSLSALAVIAVLGTQSACLADEPSGTAIAVVQSTEAQGASGNRTLAVQGAVYSGDKIVTGPFGEAQIKFRDETKLVVGPNSSLTIDAFVYSGKSAREVSIDAAKGAFRFITGISRKDAYAINTPTAVIAVRGTEFDFHVDRFDGETEVVMLGGVTQICPKTLPDGSPNPGHVGCITASRACSMTIIPPAGGQPSQLKASERRNGLINRDFRYIRDQNGLNAQFQVSLASCGAASGFITTPPASTPGSAPASPTGPAPGNSPGTGPGCGDGGGDSE
jgi:hypothetical protein